MTPDLAACAAYAADGFTMIPVCCRLVADDLTPVGAMARLAEEPYSFLFESVTGGERLARYSFVGIQPKERITLQDGLLKIIRPSGEHILDGHPFEALRRYLAPFTSPCIQGLPRFSGGLVGYFGYDIVRLVEDLPNCPPDQLGLPDIHLMRFDRLMAFDHALGHLLLIGHIDLTQGGDLASLYKAEETALQAIAERLQTPTRVRLVEPEPTKLLPFTAHTSKESFEKSVATMQEHIRAGDIFQGVPSQRLSAPLSATPFQVYRSLRSLNPSPYMFCLRLGDNSLVGASPEILVRLEDRTLAVRPIAGTCPRGATPAEDAALAAKLLADPKERAEHIMLIDLGRNDVGRVAVPGTVKLTETMVIERYSHVQHIVSHVEGKLREGLDALDVLAACHPAGTVSGAPKIEAMKIIDRLETVKRGPYAGAVGYLDYRGNCDTCIALRTAVLTPGMAHVQAGAGVVADSIPEREWEETMAKARALLMAISRADRF